MLFLLCAALGNMDAACSIQGGVALWFVGYIIVSSNLGLNPIRSSCPVLLTTGSGFYQLSSSCQGSAGYGKPRTGSPSPPYQYSHATKCSVIGWYEDPLNARCSKPISTSDDDAELTIDFALGFVCNDLIKTAAAGQAPAFRAPAGRAR